MLANRTRGALIVGALIIFALALPAGAWAVESSQITAPANPSLFFVNESGTVTVKGTSTSPKVDLRCYEGNEASDYSRVVEGVEVKGGAFEVTVDETKLSADVCALRAVPEKAEIAELGPGEESTNAKSFQGPTVVTSMFETFSNQNYFAAAATLTGSLWLESVGAYSLESTMFSAKAHADAFVFYGDAALRAYPREKESTRASLQIDGVNAYAPAAARSVGFELGLGEKGLPGAPNVSVTKSFNEATRQFTINEEDPIVKCSPENTYPPTKTSCTSFVSTGVTLARSWQTTDESKLALMADHFASIDGKEHTADARYYMEMHSGIEPEEPGGLYQFPTQVAFGKTAKGDKETLPPGGLILYKTSQTTPDAGDGMNPQAAIAYDLAPSGQAEFFLGTNEKLAYRNVSEIPYLRSVPAGGSSNTLRMAFAQGFALSEAKSMAEGALASYHPSVSISAPANGSSIVAASPTVTVSGNASDGVGLTSLTLNGKAVAVGAGGAWSIPVALAIGSNTLTATAVNQAGLASSTSVTVSYALPAAKAAIVGSASGRNGKIRLTLACNGLPGQTCQVQVLGTTLERVRGRRIISVSARTRTRSKRVTVASTTVKIPAGKRSTVVMGLNRTGRSLLGRFHSLPVRLTATLSVPGAARSTFLTRKVTVKPPPPKHRKHH